MKKLAVIDIGSNSMRLLIVKVINGRNYQLVDELKSIVRLGRDMTAEGAIDEKKIEAAIITLSHFKRLCSSYDVTEITAVATEAVRRASNQKEFISRVKEEIGIDIRVLSGNEEAYFDYLAVVNSIDVDSALLMDIGGSSTEFILVKNRKMEECISIPMGAITLTDKFLSFKGNKQKKLKELESFLVSSFDGIKWLKKAEGMTLVGIGGSQRTVAKIHRNKINYPFSNSHNYMISSKDVANIYNSLKDMEISQYRKVKGISKDRADIFIGAICCIAGVVKYCSTDKLCISENGLRQGIIYSKLIKNYPPLVENILNFSLSNIVNNYGLPKDHLKLVWHFAEKLCSAFSDVLPMKDDDYKVLKSAIMLSDCGISLGFGSQRKYSFYIIKNLKIYGLTHREQIMAAFVVSDFEESKIKKSDYFGKILDTKDVGMIKKLSLIFYISRSLDRAYDGNVTDIDIRTEKEKIILNIISKRESQLEIGMIDECKDYFYKVFGKVLLVK
ncbi:MAG TPA: exopolyphosphatase [Clostridium sp.]|jgi:exopolyphosphatase/guanosine-5'-triphosphate,3'-diphosphate pyrophosphatase|uniref:exopolyphosphatase n=1 Tax=uncultured Clostridium sp. TaxID=59620 RepID=UPI000E83C05F|nr:exopolyphosphatase [uncultured Clostridium sp.]HBC95591.1 exopolyphosphatase [Clostridium sp.]